MNRTILALVLTVSCASAKAVTLSKFSTEMVFKYGNLIEKYLLHISQSNKPEHKELIEATKEKFEEELENEECPLKTIDALNQDFSDRSPLNDVLIEKITMNIGFNIYIGMYGLISPPIDIVTLKKCTETVQKLTIIMLVNEHPQIRDLLHKAKLTYETKKPNLQYVVNESHDGNFNLIPNNKKAWSPYLNNQLHDFIHSNIKLPQDEKLPIKLTSEMLSKDRLSHSWNSKGELLETKNENLYGPINTDGVYFISNISDDTNGTKILKIWSHYEFIIAENILKNCNAQELEKFLTNPEKLGNDVHNALFPYPQKKSDMIEHDLLILCKPKLKTLF